MNQAVGYFIMGWVIGGAGLAVLGVSIWHILAAFFIMIGCLLLVGAMFSFISAVIEKSH